MKCNALVGRLKPKDPWDIYYCMRNYPGGMPALVEEFRSYRTHGLVQEALAILADQFASPDHVGPKSVADFDEITDVEERARVQRDAYERVSFLLERLKI